MSPAAELAALLRSERELRGLSPEQAQERTHIDIATVEAGYVRPGAYTLGTLLDLYECSSRVRKRARDLLAQEVT